MFLWEGRKVWYHGRQVIIVRRIDKKYVVVARATRQHLTFMANREDIKRTPYS